MRHAKETIEGKIANFNPRTPCGVRPRHYRYRVFCHGFQSTHPLRGATRQATDWIFTNTISIHAPLAGCDVNRTKTLFRTVHFNPRTPCGVRRNNGKSTFIDTIFQSTHPLRGATSIIIVIYPFQLISIHAPLAGCDLPCGMKKRLTKLFQFTHPLRGATQLRIAYRTAACISIHAPLAGCDLHFFLSA